MLAVIKSVNTYAVRIFCCLVISFFLSSVRSANYLYLPVGGEAQNMAGQMLCFILAATFGNIIHPLFHLVAYLAEIGGSYLACQIGGCGNKRFA